MNEKKESSFKGFCLKGGQYCFLNRMNAENLNVNARANKMENPKRARPFVLKKSNRNAEVIAANKPTKPAIFVLRPKYLPLSFSGTRSPIQENHAG